MRPNNRQRSRGGRNGGGGGPNQHKPQHIHNPSRSPNRNQLFDSSGPDVRVRGNAHQVFDKYQQLAREAASSGDRIMAEAYWQYADHYYRLIQTMGGLQHRNNQGWGDGGEEGQQGGPQQGQPNQGQGPGPGPQANGGTNGYDERQDGRQEGRPDNRPDNNRADSRPDNRPDNRSEGRQDARQEDRPPAQRRGDDRNDNRGDNEPGLGGVAFLQNGRGTPINADPDPADEDQPEVPEFTPTSNRRS